MTDPFAEGPVHEQGEASPFVVRLSRTAAGSVTWTVGASVPAEGDAGAYVTRLFELKGLVEARIAAPVKQPTGPSVMAQLRRSVIVEVMRKSQMAVGRGLITEAEGWMTTAEIVNHVGGHRSQVVADLKALVEAGEVEYQRGKGGRYPSTYRLAVKDTSAKAQKGVKA